MKGPSGQLKGTASRWVDFPGVPLISGRRLRQHVDIVPMGPSCVWHVQALGLIGLISGVEWTGCSSASSLWVRWPWGLSSLTHRHQLCPKVSHSSHHCTALAVGVGAALISTVLLNEWPSRWDVAPPLFLLRWPWGTELWAKRSAHPNKLGSEHPRSKRRILSSGLEAFVNASDENLKDRVRDRKWFGGSVPQQPPHRPSIT